jgi:hypothetical protein
MNEFFALIEKIKQRNPVVRVELVSEENRKFWRIIVSNGNKEVFNIMGQDTNLLFQNAYSKLQVHRKELVE